MIPLGFGKVYNEEQRKKIVEEFCSKNLSDRKKLKDLDDWCEKYLPLKDQEKGVKYKFSDVVKAASKDLKKLKDSLDKRSDLANINEELYSKKEKEKDKQVEKESGKKEYQDGKRRHSYVIDTLYGHMKDDAKNYFIKKLGVSVCPYCNRNYIYSVDGVNTCELDHFYPKHKYPIFAASFYNLIPVCSVCNRKKSETVFTFDPYDTSLDADQMIRFSYKISRTDFFTNPDAIEVLVRAMDDKYKNQIEKLELEKLYSGHNDVAFDVVRKTQLFSDSFISNLYGEFEKLFSSKEEIRELIYGVPLKKEDYGKRPLSKLTHDIVNEIQQKGIIVF